MLFKKVKLYNKLSILLIFSLRTHVGGSSEVGKDNYIYITVV